MDRRSFLQASAAIIASAAVPALAEVQGGSTVNLPGSSAVPEPIHQVATPREEWAVQSAYWKYEEALRLYDEAVQARNFPYILMPRVDKLLKFVHDNFVAPEYNPENLELTRELLVGNGGVRRDASDIMAKFRTTPPVIQESVWPIAMMTGLLRWEALPINHRQLKQFTTFHIRYGRFILEC